MNSEIIDKKIVDNIIKKLENLGVPKGSSLIIKRTEEKFDIGTKEGIAIYLDGIGLAKEIYEQYDLNNLIKEFKKLTNDQTNAKRFWKSSKGAVLYYYSDSFEIMNKSIENLINTHPLCQNARVAKIA